MTGYVADLSWKSGARAIEKLDRLKSTMAVNVLTLMLDNQDRKYKYIYVRILFLTNSFKNNFTLLN